jgi:hypothetical protein
MDPVTMVIVAGFLGGLVIAALLFRLQRRGRAQLVDRPFRTDAGSTDVINAASIKVAGIGGLGLVAMAATVALNVPRIGVTILIGLVLGSAAAVVMIHRRRQSGSMPSSGRRMGANTMLALDEPADESATGESKQPRQDRRTTSMPRTSPATP